MAKVNLSVYGGLNFEVCKLLSDRSLCTVCTELSVSLAWSYDSYTGVPGMAGGSSELTLLRSDCDCAPGSPTTWMMGVSVGGPYPHRALEQKTVWQLPVTNLVLRLLQEEL